MAYVLTTVEGLHLTCDFVIHSAALFGCPPDYTPTPVGLHGVYKEPYEALGGFRFDDYDRPTLASLLDEPTLEAIASLHHQERRLKDFTCVAFEVDSDTFRSPAVAAETETEELVLQTCLERGERILDTIRLFLFKPGQDKSIGRVGGIENGVCGAWIGTGDSDAKFVARRLFDFQFVQPALDVSLSDVRAIYEDAVFRELHSAGCCDPARDDTLLRRIFESLRSFRKSREMPTPETRFLELTKIAEHLAKRDEGEKLRGPLLRDRISRIAAKGRDIKRDFCGATADLWDSVRNPLTHNVTTFRDIGRSPAVEMPKLEEIVIAMVQAVVIAWRNEQFGLNPYASLLET